MDDLPDAPLARILRQSLTEMGAALLPWLRLSLVCRCGRASRSLSPADHHRTASAPS